MNIIVNIITNIILQISYSKQKTELEDTEQRCSKYSLIGGLTVTGGGLIYYRTWQAFEFEGDMRNSLGEMKYFY